METLHDQLMRKPAYRKAFKKEQRRTIVADMLVSFMVRRKISQAAFMDKTGMTSRWMRDTLAGTTTPSFNLLLDLMEKFGERIAFVSYEEKDAHLIEELLTRK